MYYKYPNWGGYVYCKDNPMKFIDPNGEWSEEVHNKIIEVAFKNLGFSAEQIKEIQKGAAHVDNFLNQFSSTSYQHGMRDIGQSTEDFQKKMNGFIDENTNEYMLDGDLSALGAASHTISDYLCPLHAGQVWDIKDGIRHKITEFLIEKYLLSDEDIGKMAKKVQENYLNALKQQKKKEEAERDNKEMQKWDVENNDPSF
jgi:hypothetical protein